MSSQVAPTKWGWKCDVCKVGRFDITMGEALDEAELHDRKHPTKLDNINGKRKS